jgi:hypothetical protein
MGQSRRYEERLEGLHAMGLDELPTNADAHAIAAAAGRLLRAGPGDSLLCEHGRLIREHHGELKGFMTVCHREFVPGDAEYLRSVEGHCLYIVAAARWEDVVGLLSAHSAPKPPDVGPLASSSVDESRAVRSWTMVARVLGVSRRTVERRKAKFAPDAKPWFQNASAVRTWWDHLGAPVPVKPRRPRMPPETHPDIVAFERARRGR